MRMYVAFLPADSELLESHILNKAASWVAGAANPMIHTEVVFVDRESAQDIVGRSCSIHYGGKVFLDQKRFSRKQWQFRSVSATKEQVKAAFKFCQEHVGDGFNKTGYYLQPFSERRVFYGWKEHVVLQRDCGGCAACCGKGCSRVSAPSQAI